jgi:hypothetical protein
MRASLFVVVPFAVVLLGCPVGHMAPRARAQEAAGELAVNTRFGRMEMAAEHVSPKAREQFFERRRAWGSRIRVADYEMVGLKMQGETDAEVYLKIAWYEVNSNDLHVTTLKQKWHDFKGSFQLVEEARSDGDIGLLGEPAIAPPPAGPPRNTHFPTIRLGQAKPEATPEATPETSNEASAAPAP